MTLSHRILILSWCVLLCSNHALGSQASEEFIKPIPPKSPDRTFASFVANGKTGAIATSNPLASKAGIDMLERGGNSVDAAIAASFVISVVRPQSTGIGGGGFLVAYSTQEKRSIVYDFRETAPQKSTKDMFLEKSGQAKEFVQDHISLGHASMIGHMSVGTPGLVKGLLAIHKDLGKLPLAVVMEPSINIARSGFTIDLDLANAIENSKVALSQFSSSKKIFLDHQGNPRRAGTILIQRDLAQTLEAIRDTKGDDFYQGKIAEKIISEISKGNGILSKEDLSSYQPIKREALTGNFRGFKILSMPPPSSGGTHVIQILNILEGYDLKRLYKNPETYFNILSESMRLAYADRSLYLGDTDFVKVPVRGLTSKPYANQLRSQIKPGKSGDSSKVNPGNPTPFESPSTTHISVIDQSGLAVSTTQTINLSFGSKVVAEGTGVVLNNEMDDFSIKPGVANAFGLIGSKANSIEPGKRMLSSMSPTIVLDSNDQVKMILGSPGGSRIINATVQTILNYIELGFSPQQSVHNARIHHQWKPDELYLDKGGFSESLKTKISAMGYKLTEPEWQIGDVQAIFRHENQWIAVSDTRSEGRPFASP